MERKGRDLELLIKKLESILLDHTTSIESPMYVRDRVTGVPREVDVGINGKIWNSEVFIAIECRDRTSSLEDVTRIEQLNTKKQDIGAHKMIAISSNGFTVPAREKAKFLDIETRTLDEQLTLEDINSWFKPTTLSFDKGTFFIKDTKLYPIKELSSSFTSVIVGDTSIFRVKWTCAATSLNDILRFALQKSWPNDNRPLGQTPFVNQWIGLDFKNESERYQIRDGPNWVDLSRVDFLIDNIITTIEVPFNKVVSYNWPSGTISTVVQSDYIDDLKAKVQIIKNSDWSLSFSLNALET